MTIPAPTLPINLIDNAPMQVVLDDKILIALESIAHDISALFWLILIMFLFDAFIKGK